MSAWVPEPSGGFDLENLAPLRLCNSRILVADIHAIGPVKIHSTVETGCGQSLLALGSPGNFDQAKIESHAPLLHSELR